MPNGFGRGYGGRGGMGFGFRGSSPPGLMLAWEGEDCRGVGTSSVAQRVYLGHGRCRNH